MHLTKTEIEVVRQLAEGFTQREIAAIRHRSYETIRNHVKNSIEKMHARNSVNLVALAKDMGLIVVVLCITASAFCVDQHDMRRSRLTRSFSVRGGRVIQDLT